MKYRIRHTRSMLSHDKSLKQTKKKPPLLRNIASSQILVICEFVYMMGFLERQEDHHNGIRCWMALYEAQEILHSCNEQKIPLSAIKNPSTCFTNQFQAYINNRWAMRTFPNSFSTLSFHTSHINKCMTCWCGLETNQTICDCFVMKGI